MSPQTHTTTEEASREIFEAASNRMSRAWFGIPEQVYGDNTIASLFVTHLIICNFLLAFSVVVCV